MRHNTLLMGLLVVLMLVVWTVALTGCKPKAAPQDDAALSDTPPVEPPGEAPAADVGDPTVTEFAWTDTPSLASIPAGAITGVINGQPFEAKTVRVNKADSGLTLELSDTAVDEPTDIIIKDTGVNLRFPIAEGTTGELLKSFDDEVDFEMTHAYYWYPQGDDKGPMSVNATWACALQISDWTLEANADDEAILGSVKGKVAITFDDEEKSWVAGSFDCIYYKW
jgi:hypothetical protein